MTYLLKIFSKINSSFFIVNDKKDEKREKRRLRNIELN